MNMAYYAKLYLLTVPIFFAIDMIWLGLVARGFYQSQLGSFLSERVNWTAALAFYFLYIAGILIFAVAPALDRGSVFRAVILGALFGFFTYATYDLTNLATLRDWPVKVVMVDIAWGMVLCATVSLCSYVIGRWLA
ncbi:DUF2177 family protein [bacterium]|nr:MAG: DUF2177 family protein [bacterium]